MLSGCVRSSTAVTGCLWTMCGPGSIGCRARRSVDAFPGGVLLPGDDLGVDLAEHAHGVAGPLSNLDRGHPGRQPGGHAGVAEIVGAPAEYGRRTRPRSAAVGTVRASPLPYPAP